MAHSTPAESEMGLYTQTVLSAEPVAIWFPEIGQDTKASVVVGPNVATKRITKQKEPTTRETLNQSCIAHNVSISRTVDYVTCFEESILPFETLKSMQRR